MPRRGARFRARRVVQIVTVCNAVAKPNHRAVKLSWSGSAWSGRATEFMIVYHRDRFIFFHNPKAAGITVRDALVRYHNDP